MTLALPAQLLVDFATVLRSSGLAASPDQSISFLKATKALGPRNLLDIRKAARAVFGPQPEQMPVFDALFDEHFLGRIRVVQTSEDDEEEPDKTAGNLEGQLAETTDDPGAKAAAGKAGSIRTLSPLNKDTALRQFSRLAPKRLPERITRRNRPKRKAPNVDRQRTLRAIAKHGGEVFKINRQTKRARLRPVLLLVDVSGSMKAQTEDALRFAHVLMRLPTRVEVFTLGTEWTRLTAALRLRSETQALDRVSKMVPDFDGGTLLGETLSNLLSKPRYAGFARGAIVVILSDGLEIGDSGSLFTAMLRLNALAFANIWLTPLADDPSFIPQTEALMRVQPFIDEFGSAKSIPQICAHLLGVSLSEEAA